MFAVLAFLLQKKSRNSLFEFHFLTSKNKNFPHWNNNKTIYFWLEKIEISLGSNSYLVKLHRFLYQK